MAPAVPAHRSTERYVGIKRSADAFRCRSKPRLVGSARYGFGEVGRGGIARVARQPFFKKTIGEIGTHQTSGLHKLLLKAGQNAKTLHNGKRRFLSNRKTIGDGHAFERGCDGLCSSGGAAGKRWQESRRGDSVLRRTLLINDPLREAGTRAPYLIEELYSRIFCCSYDIVQRVGIWTEILIVFDRRSLREMIRALRLALACKALTFQFAHNGRIFELQAFRLDSEDRQKLPECCGGYVLFRDELHELLGAQLQISGDGGNLGYAAENKVAFCSPRSPIFSYRLNESI